METFYIEGIVPKEYYVVMLEELNHEVDCKIFTINNKPPEIKSLLRFDVLVSSFSLLRIKDMTESSIKESEVKLNTLKQMCMYDQRSTGKEILILFNFLKDLNEAVFPRDVDCIPDYGINNILFHCDYIVHHFFRDNHTVAERIDALFNNTPKDIKLLCKVTADDYCRRSGYFKVNSDRWKAAFVLDACRYHIRERRNITY